MEGIEPTIQEAVKKYTNLPDVIIVAKLKCKNTGREVTIGNVHIQWGEMKVPDAQCVQVRIMNTSYCIKISWKGNNGILQTSKTKAMILSAEL